MPIGGSFELVRIGLAMSSPPFLSAQWFGLWIAEMELGWIEGDEIRVSDLRLNCDIWWGW